MGDKLEGKAAIVTGAARGIGASIAQAFAGEGAGVLLTDVREEEGRATADAIRSEGHKAAFQRLDVTSADDWREAVRVCSATFGGVDVLVNNAMLMRGAAIEEETIENWDRILEVGLSGAFLGIRAALPAMTANGGGSIVNISSTIGGDVGHPLLAAYQVVKGGLTALTRHVAVAYGGKGIRANAIHPGPIATPGNDEMGFLDAQAAIVARLPLNRVGEAREVAAAAVYLASADSSFVTGTALVVDGGFIAL